MGATAQGGGTPRRRMLVVGIGLLVAAILLGALVVWLPRGGTNGFDVAWDGLMRSIRRPWSETLALVFNRLGGGIIATLVVPGVIVVLLVLLRRVRAAVYAVAALAASALAVQGLKHLFGRARPEDMLVASDFGSFPSGHTANAATIAAVLWLVMPRVWMALAGVVWMLAMALSRTLLSVHWVTDTIGGMLVGVGVALLVAACFPPLLSSKPPAFAETPANSREF